MTMTQDKPLTAPEYIQFVHIAAETARSEAETAAQHLYCIECHPIPKVGVPAACGAPRPHAGPYQPIGDGHPNMCVVCWDLADLPCPGCGS